MTPTLRRIFYRHGKFLQSISKSRKLEHKLLLGLLLKAVEQELNLSPSATEKGPKSHAQDDK